MRAGRDPTGRNRNIGTERAGHGQDNRHEVPSRWGVLPYEQLGEVRRSARWVHGRKLHFLVEATRPGCLHACTVDDIACVLNALPAEHLGFSPGGTPLAAVVLRQPTRRETTLAAVWGRLIHHPNRSTSPGPLLMLEACEVPLVVRWPKRGLSLPGQDERERVLNEASARTETRRDHTLTFDLDAIRRVQLYRTLLHELGHLVDYAQAVRAPSERESADPGALEDAYWSRPGTERESFAHRYAEHWGRTLRDRGSVPFSRILDREKLRAEGLRVEDFDPSPLAVG